MNPDPAIASLLSLLDDEDEHIAVNAMAELLYREQELGNALAFLQDSTHPLVRRRVHQLQAAITLRRRRRDFLKKIQASHVDLIDGLIDVHLQWFDNDSRPGLEKLWMDFRADARRCPLQSLEEVAYFMRKSGFRPQVESTMHPEWYCIGPVLENRTGAASMLAAIAREIADPAVNFKLVRLMGDFALLDENGRVLLPLRNWQLTQAPGLEHCEYFEPRMYLKYASHNLFSAAVNSDSFRYILTIAQALNGSNGDEMMDYLPYPYYPADEEEQENEKNSDEEL